MLGKKNICQLMMALALSACAASKKASPAPDSLERLLNDSSLVHAHVGLMVADAETGKVLASHNAHRYFVPASNTKLWTMYAGLKYLGDSLVAGFIQQADDSTLLFRSAADPTTLHPDYPRQPLSTLIRQYKIIRWQNAAMQTTEYGNGWSWNDYDATYMAPRSSMPLYGNVASFRLRNGRLEGERSVMETMVSGADTFSDTAFSLYRHFDDPMFTVQAGRSKSVTTSLFLSPEANLRLAAASFGNRWISDPQPAAGIMKTVYSQHTDSMMKPLMHRSDNFFAEQTLLMISHRWQGVMDERVVIDSLLKTDLSALPDKPRWVDGSGLSRYNLFTPADYIWLLQHMRREFAMERMKEILPTGNDGTLTNYYKSLEGKLFAKTGTLAGVVALSGYLYAKSGKLLLFSTMVNNHNGSAPAVRRAVEKYLMDVWEKN